MQVNNRYAKNWLTPGAFVIEKEFRNDHELSRREFDERKDEICL